MASPLLVTLSDASFDTAVKEHDYLVVDFWAEWCAPCRAIAPAIDEFSSKYQGRITFGKLNADENPDTMMKYGIMGIPTLLVFKDGALVDTIVGAKPKAVLEKLVTKHLA
jgi:thioredoxin 1